MTIKPNLDDTPHDLTPKEQEAWMACWRTALEGAMAHPGAMPNAIRGIPLFPTSCADMMILDLRLRGAAKPDSESTLKLKQKLAELRVELAVVRHDHETANARLQGALEDVRSLRIQAARMEVHTLHPDGDEYARIRWANDRGAKRVAAHRWGAEVAEDLFPDVPTADAEIDAAAEADIVADLRERHLLRASGNVAEAREETAYVKNSRIALRAFPIEPGEDEEAVMARLAEVERISEFKVQP
jgi:hypothetical protein